MKLWIVIATIIGCLLASPAPRLHAAESKKILLAHGAINNFVAPLWIAKDQGFFRKYGLDVDLVFIIAGRAAQAMLAGQVPVAMVGATHVTNAVTAGGDLTMILGLQNTLNYFFMGRSTITKAADLKGKKVAIGTPSGSASLATYVALDYLGLNPRRDNVVLIGIGGEPERLAALRSGSVEATSLSPEYGQILVSEGFRVLLDMRKEKIPFQSSGLVVSRSYMRSNPQTVENIARSIVEGVAFVHKPENKAAVIKTLARNLRMNKPDRLETAYQQLVTELPKKPCPSTKGIASVLKLMVQHGLNPKAANVKPEDIADWSLCKKFEDSGYFQSLY
jgi:NitT/TauT family transport system substrate-binding protein